MNKKSNKELYMSLMYDIADSVSIDEDSADLFFAEEGVDIEQYVSRGIEQIKTLQKKNEPSASKPIKNNLYFKRAVLAAEIASQLYDEPTFGHVKLQKMVYLSEQICELKADAYYSKQTAGPYDRKFMHSIDSEFKRQKWFEVRIEKKGTYSKYKYNPLENVDKYKKYYSKYYSNFDNNIQWLIDTFKKRKTNDIELIATLFYCWKEIIESSDEFSESLLIENFYKWSQEKRKFTTEVVKVGIIWMRQNGLVPMRKIC